MTWNSGQNFTIFNWLADFFDVDTFIVKGLGIEFAEMALCSFIQMEKYLYYVLLGFVSITLFKMCLSTCFFFHYYNEI